MAAKKKETVSVTSPSVGYSGEGENRGRKKTCVVCCVFVVWGGGFSGVVVDDEMRFGEGKKMRFVYKNVFW